MSENISAAIAVNGEIVMKQPLIKSMRVVKKETLKLISDWVSRTNDHQMVIVLFVNAYVFFLRIFFYSIYFLYIANNYDNNIYRECLLGIGKLYTAIIRCCSIGLSKNKRSLR